MEHNKNYGARRAAQKQFSPNNGSRKNYYAVAKGRTCGIFYDWPTCRAQVDGYANALFKGFASLHEADTWMSVIKSRQLVLEEIAQTPLAAFLTATAQNYYLSTGILPATFLEEEKKYLAGPASVQVVQHQQTNLDDYIDDLVDLILYINVSDI